jgi:uncharacterized protein
MRRKEKEESNNDEIEKIIIKADTCRIAIANDNTPYLVTMNFGYSPTPAPVLYFHCANEGKKLDMIRKNNYVCFGMDTGHELYSGSRGCDWGMKFRSVIGYGNITIVTDIEEKKRGLDSIMTHYGGQGEYSYDEKTFARTTILRLDIIEITAKKC